MSLALNRPKIGTIFEDVWNAGKGAVSDAVAWTGNATKDAWDWAESNIPGAKQFAIVFPPIAISRIVAHDPVGTAAKLAMVAASGGSAAPVFLPELLNDPSVQSIMGQLGLSKEEAAMAMQNPALQQQILTQLNNDPQIAAIMADPSFQAAINDPSLAAKYGISIPPQGRSPFAILSDAMASITTATNNWAGEVKRMASPPSLTMSWSASPIEKRDAMVNAVKHVKFGGATRTPPASTATAMKIVEDLAGTKAGASDYKSRMNALWTRGPGTYPGTGQVQANAWQAASRQARRAPPGGLGGPPVQTLPRDVSTPDAQIEVRFEANAANVASGAMTLPTGAGADGIIVSPAGIQYGQWAPGGTLSAILVNPLGIQFGNWQKIA